MQACIGIIYNLNFICLPQAAKDVSHALNNCVNFLPGQKDVDEAIKAVVDSSQSLAVEDVSCSYSKLHYRWFVLTYHSGKTKIQIY